MRIPLLFLVALSLFSFACASFVVDSDSVGVSVGGKKTESTSFEVLVASEQGLIGETNSTSYRTEIGWIYAVYSDGIAPTIVSVFPSFDATTAESTATFSAIVEDLHSGLSYCTASVYRNGFFVSDVNVSPSHGYYGECKTSVSLPNEFDYSVVGWTATDNVRNTSVVTSSAQFVKSTAGQASVVAGGGFGGEGTFCRSLLQCLNGLYCFNHFCAFQTQYILRDLNDLVVTPSEIDLGKLNVDSSADQSFSLRVDISNESDRVIPIDAFFDCRTDYQCAKEWCKLREESRFTLFPKSRKKIFFDCTIPVGVSVGEAFENNLLFRTPSFAEKIVPINIPIKRPKGTYEAVPQLPVPFTAFVPLYSLVLFGDVYPTLKGFSDYGLLCFGELKQDCLFRLGFFSLLGVVFTHLSLSTLLLAVLLALNLGLLVKKEKNLVLLIALIGVILLKIAFFVF